MQEDIVPSQLPIIKAYSNTRAAQTAQIRSTADVIVIIKIGPPDSRTRLSFGLSHTSDATSIALMGRYSNRSTGDKPRYYDPRDSQYSLSAPEEEATPPYVPNTPYNNKGKLVDRLRHHPSIPKGVLQSFSRRN